MSEKPEQTVKIKISIDPSLLNHFREHMREANSDIPPEDAITQLVAAILNNSEFPIEAQQTANQEIHMGYHLHSFSQPMFW